MVFSDASVADPQFVAPDVASEQQLRLEVTASDGTTTVTDTIVVIIAPGNESPLTNALFGGSLSAPTTGMPSQRSSRLAWDSTTSLVLTISEAAAPDGRRGLVWVGSVYQRTPSDSNRTSMATADGVTNAAKGHADFDDGLPIVFSWPVATKLLM